jgi:hypothetical protein
MALAGILFVPAGPRPRLDVALPVTAPGTGEMEERLPPRLDGETFGRARHR